MDLSELEKAIASLENSAASWENWLFASTLLVVVGLIAEYWFDIGELIRERPFKLKQFIEVSGAIAVTLGVAGELGFRASQSSDEASLRVANDKVIGLLNESASKLSLEAKTAEGKIADAQKVAATANRAAAEATERAARIEQAAAWRILTPDQISRLISSLSTSKHTVQIAFMKGDPESQFLQLQFADVVNRAGWEFGSWEVHLGRVVFFGLAVLDKPDSGAGRALSQALSYAGIGANPLTVWPGQGYEGDGGYHEAEITLLIGSKFPPPNALGSTALKPLPSAAP